jgi:predicted O-methyltransferase YrrM
MPPFRGLLKQRDDFSQTAGDLRRTVEDRTQTADDLRQRLEQLAKEAERIREALSVAVSERDEAWGKGELLVADLQEARQRIDEQAADLRLFGEGPPFVPNGHFYSPIAPKEELRRDAARIFASWPRTMPGIDLREDKQLKLLDVLKDYYPDLPFQSEKVDGLRYHYENPAYSYSDGIFLNGMIRYAKPKKVIEVGSGYSSCMLLDTNELWFDNSIKCTFVEPYPNLLHSLLKDGDLDRIRVHGKRVQDVEDSLFVSLEENDILFVDSTHVSRTGSDVNHIIFNVLPSLAEGVYIHFHDIFYPFEYAKQWIDEGRAWNEAYLLRAFLQNNSDFEIVAFNTFLEHFHPDYFRENMPLCLKNRGGSIWLRKKKTTG